MVTSAPMRSPAPVFWIPSSSLMFLMFTRRWGVWKYSFMRLIALATAFPTAAHMATAGARSVLQAGWAFHQWNPEDNA